MYNTAYYGVPSDARDGNSVSNRASDLAIDANGNIVVIDTWNQRIKVYNSAGTYIYGFDLYVFDIYSDISLAIDGLGNIIIRSSAATVKCSSTGTIIYRMVRSTSTQGGIAVDKNGTVIISENYTLNKYRDNAIYQTPVTISTANWNNELFQNSCSIAINPNGNVFFCDTNTSRIMVFV